jgi:hypothetical protein
MTTDGHLSQSGRWTKKLLLLVISTSLMLASVEVGVRVLAPCPLYEASRFVFPNKYFEYHPVYGWIGKKSVKGAWDTHAFRVTVEHDARGFRNETDPFIAGKRNILILGDSYVWGWGVSNGEMFTNALMDSNPQWNVYALAVPGWGTDQQYLALRDFLDQDPRFAFSDIVLVYFWNDAFDVVEDMRYGYLKPLFELDGEGALRVTNVPVPKDRVPTWDVEVASVARTPVLSMLHSYNRLVLAAADQPRTRSDPTPNPALSVALIKAIGELARDRGAKFRIVFLDANAEGSPTDAALLAHARESRVPHVAFRSAARFPPCRLCFDVHLSPRGHQILAEQLERLMEL